MSIKHVGVKLAMLVPSKVDDENYGNVIAHDVCVACEAGSLRVFVVLIMDMP